MARTEREGKEGGSKDRGRRGSTGGERGADADKPCSVHPFIWLLELVSGEAGRSVLDEPSSASSEALRLGRCGGEAEATRHGETVCLVHSLAGVR